MMTTTNPNTAFKTTDNTHRHNHTILHHIGRRLLLLTILLAMAVGVKAQEPTPTTHPDGVYKIFWQWNGRGYLTYHNDYPTSPQLAGVTLSGYQNSHYSLSAQGIQLSWYLYTSPHTKKSYLFEATTGKFITINLDQAIGNGKQCVLSEDVTAQAQLDLKATTNTTGYMLSYENFNFCSGCGSPKGADPVRFATDGQTDGGIPFVFVSEGASITDGIKNAAIEKIEEYEQQTATMFPIDGKAYTFTNIMGDAASTKRHMKYTSGVKISLTTNENEASVFVCRKIREGVYVFVTTDGKVLTWVGNNEGGAYKDNGQQSPLGYSNYYASEYNGKTDWNEITIKQVENEETVGQLRMVARRNSTSVSSFIVSNANDRFDQSGDNYYFNESFSSVWQITEIKGYTANETQNLALAKIDAKETVKHSKIPGTKVCQYTYAINGTQTTETSIINTAIDAATTIDELNAIKNAAVINQPEVGKYYRIKAYVSQKFIDAANSSNTTSAMAMMSYGDYDELGTIFRLDADNVLFSLGTGSYVYDTYKIGANNANQANTWTFKESTRTPGCFTLTSNEATDKELHDGGDYASSCDNICGDSHDFILEETELPTTPAPKFVPNADFTEFTLTCTNNHGYIFYTTNGNDPTAPGATTLMLGDSKTFTAVEVANVKAYAKKGAIPASPVVGVVAVNTADDLKNITGSSYYYLATDGITASSHTSIAEFKGTFEGRFFTINNLNTPLFASADGAIIKNVVLKDVSITGGTDNVGAIVGTAQGKTRIFNCGVLSGRVGGDTNVGSIAGRIEDAARVINCYSFANITGGNTVGGIVGYNAGSYVKGAPQTMVMNCAYYGNLNGGANRYPIFGGHNITNNQGDNTYNFFRHNESITYKGYNSAQAIFKDEYLDRFEFYRSILNSHRELAAYYAFNDVSNAGEIGKWTLDKSRAPYPIVTKHLSNTQKTLMRTIPVTDEAYAGKKIKDINVTININGKQVYKGTLPMTDMNTAEWDYTYGKIVLPFANEFTGWSIGDAQAITGWKISTNDYYYNQNNVFNNENYVYAQGGNYIVPEGVTALTLTAYVAPAVYLSDASYDVVYGTEYNSAIARGGSTPTKYKEQNVYHTLSDAINALQLNSNSNLPHEQAIVLVGNYHYNQKIESGVLPQSTTSHFNNNKPFTLMSADKDNDQEPDYCFYQFHAHGSGRTMVHPIRFDFVASPGIGMASHVEGAAAVPNIGIWHGKGWFELTETYLGIMQECEIRPGYFLVNAPWIINGGIFEEINMSSTHEYENPNTQSDDHGLTYIRIGGNAYINNFYPGTQSKDATFTTPLKPICMSGGEVVSCYMTGKQPEKSVTSGSVNFFCNGGYIHEFLGAYLEPLATNQDINVRVDHALIDNFYGGGANENRVTPGNINITINNSQVGFFCGGPKFGNMTNGKKVTINATGTTFGEFYGGGYGGTALTRKEVQGVTIDFGGNDRTYGLNYESNYKDNRLKYDANLGIAVNYSLQYFMYAGGGGRGVEKFNVDYARLSLAAVGGDITSNLTDCTILNNFYGGGCQGSVTGNITSTLNNCKIGGSAFAAGYTANATPCLVATNEQPTYSKFVLNLGYFTPFGEAYTEEFYWKAADADHEVGSTDDANKTLYTTEEKFTNMGQVTGNTKIVVKGASEIEGSVFGGGNASKVIGNTHVHIQGGTIKGNVFGAGNQAEVTGKTEVVIGE